MRRRPAAAFATVNPRPLHFTAIAAWIAAAAAAAAATAAEPSRTITVSRAATAPVVDGRIDDPAWRDAAPISDFHQQRPDYREPPTERTVVRITYDQDHIYIGARLFDAEPQRIRATQLIQGRDISADDRFWCSLDTFNSKRNDYFFEVNANGVRSEALRENNSRFIAEWTTIWEATSRITDDGWSTEMAIPFKSISFDTSGGIWRVNCGRWIMRKQEHVLLESSDRLWWAADSRELYGISDVRQGLGLDIAASTTLEYRRDIVAGRREKALQPSLDAYYRFTPSLTGALTLNSDFSTAEVDDVQVALDRFSLFFPEKRDFFLQDAGIFEFGNLQTNGRPFFSRRIGLAGDGTPLKIQAGGKLTGRAGRFNMGALAVRQEGAGASGSQALAVVRASANVLEESALGFIATHGDPRSERSNSLYGADFLYRTRNGPFGGTLQGQLWLQRSRTPGLHGDDMAMGGTLDYPNDRINWNLSVMEIQQNFNPALGFVNRRGIRQYDGTFRHRTRPRASIWREVDQELGVSLVTGVDGERQSRLVRVRPLRLATPSNDSVYVEWQQNRELVAQDFTLFGRLLVPAADYRFDHWRVEFATGTQRAFSLTTSIQNGSFFGGRRLQTEANVQWRPSKHFYLRLGYSENDVRLPDGEFTSRLAQLQADVAVNPYWSLSTLVQYDNAADFVGGSARLRYRPHDGQEMLLVVNSNYTTDVDDRFVNTYNEALLKLSYTLRF